MTSTTYAKKLAKADADALAKNKASDQTKAELRAKAADVRKLQAEAEADRAKLLASVKAGKLADPLDWAKASAKVSMTDVASKALDADLKRLRYTNTDTRLADAIADVLRQELDGLGIEILTTCSDVHRNHALLPPTAGTVVASQPEPTDWTDEGRMTGRSVRLHWVHGAMHKSLDVQALAKAAAKLGIDLELSDNRAPIDRANGTVLDTYGATITMDPVGIPELSYLPADATSAILQGIPSVLHTYRQRLTDGINPTMRLDYRLGYIGHSVELTSSSVDEHTGNVSTNVQVTGVLCLQKHIPELGDWHPVPLSHRGWDGAALDAAHITASKLTVSDIKGTLIEHAGTVAKASGLDIKRATITIGREDIEVLAIEFTATTEGHVSEQVMADAAGLDLDDWIAERDELEDIED